MVLNRAKLPLVFCHSQVQQPTNNKFWTNNSKMTSKFSHSCNFLSVPTLLSRRGEIKQLPVRMDWFNWLSKTDLDPTVVYEYALTFTHNELGQDDVAYFSHEFLQSMGVSIAKHRLEILKLARKFKKKSKGRSIHPVLWFMFAVKQTKSYVVKHIQALARRESSPLSVVPTRNHSLRWKVAMLQRNTRLRAPRAKTEWPMLGNDGPRLVSDPGILMLTNGSPSRSSGSTHSSIWIESEANAESGHITTTEALANPWNSSFSRTTILSPDRDYWSSSTDEIKWDSMFKNLKPT